MIHLLEPSYNTSDSFGGRVVGMQLNSSPVPIRERVPCNQTDGSYRRSAEMFMFMHTLLIFERYSLVQTASEPLSPLFNRNFIMFLNLCQFQRG